MVKATAWEVIGGAMNAYQATATGDPHRVQAVWDAQTRGTRAAIGRHIAGVRDAAWCDQQGDPFNKFLAFVEEMVAADRRLFPATDAGLAATLETVRDGLAKLRGAFRLWPSEVTADLIRHYEDAERELVAKLNPPAPKVPPRGGQHARPTTDDAPMVISIMGRDYAVSGLPVHSSIGSHAFQLRGLHHGVAYDLYRDLFGMARCDCGSGTFRDGELCKHASALIEAGLMPLPATAPLQPFARRRRFEPTADDVREAAVLMA